MYVKEKGYYHDGEERVELCPTRQCFSLNEPGSLLQVKNSTRYIAKVIGGDSHLLVFWSTPIVIVRNLLICTFQNIHHLIVQEFLP